MGSIPCPESGAFDEKAGDTLWSIRLNAVPISSPITYSVGGKQDLAFAETYSVADFENADLGWTLRSAPQAPRWPRQEWLGGAANRRAAYGGDHFSGISGKALIEQTDGMFHVGYAQGYPLSLWIEH